MPPGTLNFYDRFHVHVLWKILQQNMYYSFGLFRVTVFFCFFFCFPVIACLNIAQATFCREEKDVVYLYIMLPKYSTWGKISVYVLLKYQYKCCSFFALRLLKQSLSTETTRNLFHKQGLGVGRSGISVLSFKFCFSVVTIIFSKNGLLCIPEVAHCN